MYIDPNPKVEEKRAEYRDELMKNGKLWERYNEYKNLPLGNQQNGDL